MRNIGSLCLPVVFILGGVAIMAVSPGYTIGTFIKPGAGFWPMVMGAALFVLGLAELYQTRRKPQEIESLALQQIVKIAGICGCLVLWIMLSLLLGWLVATFAASFVLAKLFGMDGFWRPAVLALAITISSYYLFGVWFFTDLPTGILGF